MSVACAPATPGSASATSSDEDERTPHGTGTPPANSERCPKIGATSRSEKSITATAIHVAANPYAQTGQPRAEGGAEREDGRNDHRPADQVMEEGRAREEPAVLLVDQEGRAGDEQPGRRHERPVGRDQPAADDRELHRACGRRRLRPGRVREQMERREGREDRDHPEPQPGEEQRGSARGAPARHGAGTPPGPTIASARRTSAKNRNPAAKSQCAISARGSISGLALALLEIVDQPGRHDQGEQEPDEHDEERRLDEPVPECPCPPGRRTSPGTAARAPRRSRRARSAGRAPRLRAPETLSARRAVPLPPGCGG